MPPLKSSFPKETISLLARLYGAHILLIALPRVLRWQSRGFLRGQGRLSDRCTVFQTGRTQWQNVIGGLPISNPSKARIESSSDSSAFQI
eukprot:6206148-Pleurochrysis_carterae.AAC.5